MAIAQREGRKAANTRRLPRWTAPRMARLSAGAAENGSGPLGDDQVNHS